MNRLLFAAARGARVQYKLWNKWDNCTWNPSYNASNNPDKFRIHPEDEHLQYGPISSALRENAEISPRYYFDSRLSAEAGYAIGAHRVSGLYDMADELHRSLFLLILSECLADEGL